MESFSKRVKLELEKQLPIARHCRLAELSAILCGCGQIIHAFEGKKALQVQSENDVAMRKCFTLLKKTFNMNTEITVFQKQNDEQDSPYLLQIDQQEQVERVLAAAKLYQSPLPDGSVRLHADGIITQNTCCKRAFIRGSFLVAGSVSDPEKAYHFELVYPDPIRAKQMRDMIASFGIDAKIILRKNSYVVYIKEGAQIVDLLNVMEAHVSLMEMENSRILKEVRNSVNRKVNCEAANINRSVQAATKQKEDVCLIRDKQGLESLPDGLREMAQLRLATDEEMPLCELGKLLHPPLGKSGVNHRLMKLSEIAQKLREQS